MSRQAKSACSAAASPSALSPRGNKLPVDVHCHGRPRPPSATRLMRRRSPIRARPVSLVATPPDCSTSADGVNSPQCVVTPTPGQVTPTGTFWRWRDSAPLFRRAVKKAAGRNPAAWSFDWLVSAAIGLTAPEPAWRPPGRSCRLAHPWPSP